VKKTQSFRIAAVGRYIYHCVLKA